MTHDTSCIMHYVIPHDTKCHKTWHMTYDAMTKGWPILRATAHAFLSCEDSVTGRGMRILYSPLPGDQSVTSGQLMP